MLRRIAAFLLLLSATLSADTYPRQPGIDVVHYVFRIGLSDQSSEISGETTITARFLRDAVAELNLDLTSVNVANGMTVQSVRRGGPIEVPGPPSDNIVFTHNSNRLHVVLPPGSRAGQEFVFTIRYRGTAAEGLRIGPNMHGDRSFFGENWPNQVRNWLPMIDHPYDKATGEFIVTAPNQYQVVANGLLIEEIDLPNNVRRTHWKQSVPIASWLYTIAVARFSSHSAGAIDRIPIQTWVFPQDREAGQTLFENTSRRAMQFFIGNIGPYPYEKLANVQATGFTGGTEYASAIFYGEKGVSAGRGPVVHEIAHQWFGNSVTERDWDDVWLSEGFATYFALLFTEHDEGRDAFVDGLKRSRAQVLQLEQKLSDTPVIHRNLADMSKVLNGLVYQKGAWVLHMLRQEVGTANFWAAAREYYRRYRDSNASTADLRAVFEQVSGRNLEWFFTQWLNRAGVPRIEGSWRYDAARRVVEVTVTQSQAAPAFRAKLDVGIVGQPGDLPRVQTIEMVAKHGTFTFPLDAAPSSVVLDPNTTLLMQAGAFVRK
ncbi:MAG TPA: M1 family aminopeptidase [Vicinamibacterales bacterium]